MSYRRQLDKLDSSFVDIDRRVGRFIIDFSAANNWFLLTQVMRGLVVTHLDTHFDFQRLEYTAHGPQFDEIPEGVPIPEYEILCNTDEGWIEFRRKEK